jgi:hypothetical protein
VREAEVRDYLGSAVFAAVSEGLHRAEKCVSEASNRHLVSSVQRCQIILDRSPEACSQPLYALIWTVRMAPTGAGVD